jgi:hypothetical protein
LINFPASKPHGPPLSVVFTHRLFITLAEGLDPLFQLPRHHGHQMVNGAQQVAVSPVVEIVLDRYERREVPRQQASLAAGRSDVSDRARYVA